MTEATSKLVWTKLDISTLQPMAVEKLDVAKRKYLEYRAAQDDAEKAVIRDSRETMGLRDEFTLAFGYRFGPIPAIAVVPVKSATTKGAKSLADIVAMAQPFKSETTLIKKAS
jgi:hypothetical protein